MPVRNSHEYILAELFRFVKFTVDFLYRPLPAGARGAVLPVACLTCRSGAKTSQTVCRGALPPVRTPVPGGNGFRPAPPFYQNPFHKPNQAEAGGALPPVSAARHKKAPHTDMIPYATPLEAHRAILRKPPVQKQTQEV
ncbi:hypothetical protein A7X67_02010 [Clostridium sp. W14A]|nr:hypothetical protein A7X67_02010 [Clostridium sp. W14A]